MLPVKTRTKLPRLNTRFMLHRLLCRFPVVALPMFIALLTACHTPPAYHNYRSVSVEGWESKDTLAFSIDSLPTEGTYVLSLGVRTAVNYPFQSLWVVVKQSWSTPLRQRIDTVACTTHDNHGNALGTGVARNQQLFAVDTLQLPIGARGTIGIRHIMRRDLLPGVSDVGIELQKAD